VRKGLVVLGAVLVTAVAGAGVAANASSTLTAETDRALVTTPGHQASEFTVARDPRDPKHLIAASMDWDTPSGTVGCVANISNDGGRTWTTGGGIDQNGHHHVDPWVTIDDNGDVYLACIDLGIDAAGALVRTVQVAKSVDGGSTFGSPVSVPQTGAATRDAVFATNGDLFVCFEDGDLTLVRSVDGGATWLPATKFAGLQAECDGIVAGPTGTLYLGWTATGGSAPASTFGTAVSSDGGASWSTTAAGQIGGTASGPPFPQAAAPSIAVSPTTGHVFIASQRAVQVDPVRSRTALRLQRSTDDGATFQDVSVTLPATATCADCSVLNPTVTVNDAGELGLQLTLSDDNSLHHEVWFLVSSDEGAHWLAPVQLGTTDATSSYVWPEAWVGDAAFYANGVVGLASDPDPSRGLGLLMRAVWPYFHRDGGEYFGITSEGSDFVTMWVDHFDHGRSQIWSRIVGA